MRADFVSQGMNHAEGGWPKVNNVTWLYSWCVLVHMSVYFLWNFCNILPFLVKFGKPWPKNNLRKSFGVIWRNHHRISITINIFNIIQISISISGYQSQWERSDYALPQENWKGREVSGSVCFSSNFDHVCCLDSILVVIIIVGASAINSIFQYP